MKNLLRYIFILLFSLCSITSFGQKVIKKYIKKYEGMAVERMKKFEIPASIILGVSIVESGAGTSDLARVFNNYFGIKGKNKDSRKKLGYQSEYKEYPTDTASFDHFCKVISSKKFYKKLKGSKDYKEWLNQMNKASYAEAKQTWIDKITTTIVKNKLYKIDEDK